ncbi:hypothetical protein CLV24_1623 [Pontibacter ummariensis]|uniref:Transcriptional regulator n=1 Tax=Pontibacter ummariensis TaxID=1610492 RepID=A0A239M2Y3_9BACT|nr:hypothetical protein [Pontibacter ummariensis]PRX99267.1 hypothetical protein CLV24_1623 [Pontibacter ummariensis]SNT36249.1 hypothetical protein SAMN06296052_1633 [Pontibacter ummariensis]
MNIDKKQAAQTERIGVTLEKSAIPPLAARIMALLLVAEPPYCSFNTIMEALQASKSSAGPSLNLLLREGIVDYITFPGDRKRYFIDESTLVDAVNSPGRFTLGPPCRFLALAPISQTPHTA